MLPCFAPGVGTSRARRAVDSRTGAIHGSFLGSAAGAAPAAGRAPVALHGAPYEAAPTGSVGVSASWSFFVSSSESEVLITVPP